MFQAYHGLVFRTAYRITGNAADAEDALQTVFLRMMRRERAASGSVEKQESYFRRAAVNVSLDILRVGKNSRSVPLDDTHKETLAERTGPDSRELRQCLRRALALLTPREAEIFALRFFEDQSNQEIARTLGISQVHVAVILHRTRGRLQKDIRNYLGDRI